MHSRAMPFTTVDGLRPDLTLHDAVDCDRTLEAVRFEDIVAMDYAKRTLQEVRRAARMRCLDVNCDLCRSETGGRAAAAAA